MQRLFFSIALVSLLIGCSSGSSRTQGTISSAGGPVPIGPATSSSAASSTNSSPNNSSVRASSSASSLTNPPDNIELLVMGIGFYSLNFDRVNSTFSSPNNFSTMEQASYGVLSQQELIYVLDSGLVRAYRWNGSSLTDIDSRSQSGSDGVHISLHPNENFLASANLGSGEIVVYRLDGNGVFDTDSEVIEHDENSGAHWVEWDSSGDTIYAVFRGDNVVRRYSFNPQTGEIGSPVSAWQGQADDGPRHLAFHPSLDIAYILNETSNTVVITQIQANGNLRPIQTISNLPANFTSNNTAAHIQVSKDGNHLYTSNQGHNSIAVFSIENDGQLNLVEHELTNIDTPQAFLLVDDAGILFVANRGGDSVSAFNVGAAGELEFISESRTIITNPRFLMELPRP